MAQCVGGHDYTRSYEMAHTDSFYFATVLCVPAIRTGLVGASGARDCGERERLGNKMQNACKTQTSDGDVDRLSLQIGPLLDWLQRNSARLKEMGKWPLQQEDIPENLLPLWQLYRAHRQGLQTSNAARKGLPTAQATGKGLGLHANAHSNTDHKLSPSLHAMTCVP
jgi:hypothetical protein